MIASAEIVGMMMEDLAKMSPVIHCPFVTPETVPTTVYGALLVRSIPSGTMSIMIHFK